MGTVLASGEPIQVLMTLGFPTDPFTLDSATLGLLNGQSFLDGTLIGEDVAEYVQDLSINRGRSDQLASFQAGTVSVTLLNNDRRFDPTNTASPYFDPVRGRSGLQPRRKLQIVADGETVFTGKITDYDLQYDLGPNQTSTVTVSAADDFVTLATLNIQPNTPIAELSGARVEFVLDLPEVGWPLAARSIATGTANLGPYAISGGTNALNYLQQIEKAEQGLLFIDRSGVLTFTDRTGAAFVQTVADFTDDGSALPYTSLSVVAGQEFFFNQVVASRSGGVEQVANDATSQTDFGILSLSLTDLLLDNDADAATLAADLLTRFAEPTFRFDVMTVDVHALPPQDRFTVLALELGDAIRVTRNYATGSPSSISLDVMVDRLRHRITPATHTVEIGLAFLEVVFAFILDDATFGTLDTSNALQ